MRTMPLLKIHARLVELLTFIHHDEVKHGTVVPVLLLLVASKTSVLAPVLESDVPQQDGNVVVAILPHKLHPLSKYSDVRHHSL